MYHCPVTFYLVGLPDEIARIIEDAQPQPSFTHHFTRSDEPEEALTAQASASTGGLKWGAANSAKPIILMLRNVGAKAGTEKRFQVLRIAPTSEAREISKI